MPIQGRVPGNKEYWAAKPDDEFASDLKDAIIQYYRQTQPGALRSGGDPSAPTTA